MPDDPRAERRAGEALRARVIDPLGEVLEGVERIVVTLDGALHGCPLDALPDGVARLGDRLAIEVRSSLIERRFPRREPDEVRRQLVAFGGIRFDAPEEEEVEASAPLILLATGGGGNSRFVRSGERPEGFVPLPGSAAETRAIANLHEMLFPDRKTMLLTEDRATRAALFDLADRARWLHLATHGWFSPESIHIPAVDAPLDTHLGLDLRMSPSELVARVSPMVLCGLALAGANQPPDELGRVAGTVTAEELANLDLAGCELAVLSACDTSVGVGEAGQGVASLQKALHMAGARSVVTSLWKVPDEATRELMVAFYRGMWEEGLSKDRALWEAKRVLRGVRAPDGSPLYGVGDWAAWRLTGDPD